MGETVSVVLCEDEDDIVATAADMKNRLKDLGNEQLRGSFDAY